MEAAQYTKDITAANLRLLLEFWPKFMAEADEAQKMLVEINPDSPLGNLTSFPLCKRGTEGDFCVHVTLKSPLAPLLQRGECVVIARIRSNG